jgi:oxaloacetate decarboxylase alpha subunit
MGEDVYFEDTTFRDGSQSLWAMGMRHGMMEPIASDMDAAGYRAIEVPVNGIVMKKIVRDLKEDPFEILRMIQRKMPNTVKVGMGTITASGGLGSGAVPEVVEQLARRMTADILHPYCAKCGVATTPERMREFKDLGMLTLAGIPYSISPRHTVEHFAAQYRATAALGPDALYLKDQGGLLTVDSIRVLIPILIEAGAGIPVELHSHCTTGLAPAVYAEAMKLGVRTLHTGIPPASDGSAQPSVLDTARNARALGFNPIIDEELIRSVSKRLTSLAKQEGLPLGEPVRYDEFHFAHQIPGGVISNLRFQLEAINMGHLLEQVKLECIRIREELGYPIMITPYSQHMVTQATINIMTGERYKVVIDDVIRFAQGHFGQDSGYLGMDQDLKDRLLSSQRAGELAASAARPVEDMTLRQAKELYGTADMSDEDLILRCIMQGSAEVDAMRRAGPPRRYSIDDTPLLTLLKELDKHRRVRYVSVQRGGDALHVQNRDRSMDLQPVG